MFRDTDDAMRMVQVRDLMAGQSWYDMVAHRLDPPQGLLSHWSRIVDTPLVLLVKAFGLLLPYEAAERAARIAFPFLLLVGLFRACAYAAQVFAGPRMAIAGAIAAALCSVASWQFPPGRIDHHAPQILLADHRFAAMADSLDPARAGRAAWAAAAIALSLGIGSRTCRSSWRWPRRRRSRTSCRASVQKSGSSPSARRSGSCSSRCLW